VYPLLVNLTLCNFALSVAACGLQRGTGCRPGSSLLSCFSALLFYFRCFLVAFLGCSRSGFVRLRYSSTSLVYLRSYRGNSCDPFFLGGAWVFLSCAASFLALLDLATCCLCPVLAFERWRLPRFNFVFWACPIALGCPFSLCVAPHMPAFYSAPVGRCTVPVLAFLCLTFAKDLWVILGLRFSVASWM